MGRLQILDGDVEKNYTWSPASEAETRSAKEKFESYKSKGFIACKIPEKGKPGIQVDEFDPEAEEIFMLGLAEGG